MDSRVQRTNELIFYRFILFVFESFKTSKLTVRYSVPMRKCITSVLLDFNLPVAYARCSHAQICSVVATDYTHVATKFRVVMMELISLATHRNYLCLIPVAVMVIFKLIRLLVFNIVLLKLKMH